MSLSNDIIAKIFLYLPLKLGNSSQNLFPLINKYFHANADKFFKQCLIIRYQGNPLLKELCFNTNDITAKYFLELYKFRHVVGGYFDYASNISYSTQSSYFKKRLKLFLPISTAFIEKIVPYIQSYYHCELITSLHSKHIEKVKHVVQQAVEVGLLLPPDFILFISYFARIGVRQDGFYYSLDSIQISPYCWSFGPCSKLIRFAEMCNGYGDGSTYFFINCDPADTNYGRLYYYIYRDVGNFRFFKEYSTWTDLLYGLIITDNFRCLQRNSSKKEPKSIEDEVKDCVTPSDSTALTREDSVDSNQDQIQKKNVTLHFRIF